MTASSATFSVGSDAALNTFQARKIGLDDFIFHANISSHFATCRSVMKIVSNCRRFRGVNCGKSSSIICSGTSTGLPELRGIAVDGRESVDI